MSYTSGSASDEQDLATKIGEFLTGECGWSLLDTVTDNASDVDKVYYSEGRNPGTYRPLYVRWRGYSNQLRAYAYTFWYDSGTYTDEIHNGSYSYAPCSSPPHSYWLFGDQDRLIVVLKNSSSYHSMYAGYIDTYYSSDVDDIPVCVVGHSSASTSLTGSRAMMYVPFTVSSGTTQLYYSSSNLSSNCLKYGSPNERDGSIAILPAIMYCNAAGYREVRGELLGWYWVNGAGVSSETWITISGTDDKFFITDYSDTHAYAYGPVKIGEA